MQDSQYLLAVYLAAVCVGLHVGLLLILWNLEVEMGRGGGGELDGIGAGGRELRELGLLLMSLLAALLWVAERVLQQHFLNRLPHLKNIF